MVVPNIVVLQGVAVLFIFCRGRQCVVEAYGTTRNATEGNPTSRYVRIHAIPARARACVCVTSGPIVVPNVRVSEQGQGPRLSCLFPYHHIPQVETLKASPPPHAKKNLATFFFLLQHFAYVQTPTLARLGCLGPPLFARRGLAPSYTLTQTGFHVQW
jgi:hypothetical protein